MAVRTDDLHTFLCSNDRTCGHVACPFLAISIDLRKQIPFRGMYCRYSDDVLYSMRTA